MRVGRVFLVLGVEVTAALSAAVTTTKLIGDQPHVAWAHKFAGTYKPIPSYSSGEGVWGRGASLREAASPPEFPHSRLFGRERERGDFLTEKSPPSHTFMSPPVVLLLSYS